MKQAGRWWLGLDDQRRRRIAADSVLLLLLCAACESLGFEAHDECCGCVMDYCQTPGDLVAALRGGFKFCEHCTETMNRSPEGAALLQIAEHLTRRPFRVRPLHVDDFDVFLCYHGADRPAVQAIASRLRTRGVKPWLDVEQLPPGRPWQRLLEQQIAKIRSAAVSFGPSGRGPWQDLELEAFLREFVGRQCPVIPVILSDSPPTPELPTFLRGMTWVDFRASEPDPLDQLIWGITGERPVPLL